MLPAALPEKMMPSLSKRAAVKPLKAKPVSFPEGAGKREVEADEGERRSPGENGMAEEDRGGRGEDRGAATTTGSRRMRRVRSRGRGTRRGAEVEGGRGGGGRGRGRLHPKSVQSNRVKSLQPKKDEEH